MDKRLSAIAVGMTLLAGCQSPAQPTFNNSTRVSSSPALELDEPLGERAEPGELETDQRIAVQNR